MCGTKFFQKRIIRRTAVRQMGNGRHLREEKNLSVVKAECRREKPPLELVLLTP